MTSPIITSRQRHLDVVEIGTASEQEVDRELRKLDPDLFLDKEYDAEFQRFVFSAKLRVGQMAHLVTDWRDERTREPLDISYGLLYKVRRQEANNLALKRPLMDEVRAENEKRQAKAAEESHRQYSELTRDIIPAIKGLRSPVFHRPTTAKGIAAARSRARRRDAERKMGLR